ncbi:catalase-peroxidase [Cyclobacterium xiamenense]|uniref:Catalase-peroxidase n=1 Tax=Cyclobacterium xiamenense TaxID=1297121 RepID=A0A1H7BHF8_9BACT|nr:catalase-peroxidase [Cyclobacterium xiamenense]
MKKSIVFSWLLIIGALFSGCQRTSEPEADGYSGATQKSNSNRIATSNSDWWPNQLNLSILRQNSSLSNPMGESFNYAAAFTSLDYQALKKDIEAVMTESQDW